MIATYEQIERERGDVEQSGRNYLKRFGWSWTCQTPGSYWLWEKKLDDGRTVLIGEDHAIEMTRRCWDHDGEAEGGEKTE